MKSIPYCRQSLDESDFKSVAKALGSDYLTQGPKVREFEEALAAYCGARYAVAVSNGTAALHLAAIAAGLGKGDEAITSPITFLATPNAALYVGAKPVFADIDYSTVNIDPKAIEAKLTRRTKAILPVDMAGLPADMEAISKIAKRQGLMVIEDACHALGGEYKKGKVGSCAYSDMTVFSFHPAKHITTGEGGCITTHSKKLYEKLCSLRSHGVARKASTQRKMGGWYYEMSELGWNYRITDIQCALGMSQLRKLDGFIDRRRKIAKMYDAGFADMPELRVPSQESRGEKHVYHLYLLRMSECHAGTRRSLYDHLKSKNVHCQVHYIPVYRQPYYRKMFGDLSASCPNAERYYGETLSLPMFFGLKDAEARYVIRTVREFFKGKA
ncbi:MAG: UDP-4-amino-4,6-dideoxy-N-acetyl-beta-L-altrosamine transaminase [Candidatus Omnitrophota bacterium]